MFKQRYILSLLFYLAVNGCGLGPYIDPALQKSFDFALNTVISCGAIPQNVKDIISNRVSDLRMIEVENLADNGKEICGQAELGGYHIKINKSIKDCPDKWYTITHELLHIGGMTHNSKDGSFEVFYDVLRKCTKNSTGWIIIL